MFKRKALLMCIAMLLVPSFVFICIGDFRKALVVVGLIPLFFAAWGLSLLLFGRKNREIVRHLNNGEREQLNEIAKSYGRKMGIYALIFFAPVGIVYYALDSEEPAFFAAFFGLILALSILLGLRQRKAIAKFLSLTTRSKKERENQPLNSTPSQGKEESMP